MRDWNTISALFGNKNSNSGINLGDYSLIKSGSYKKLMKAYYAKDKTSADKNPLDINKTEKPVKKESIDTTGLTKMKAEADGLKTATKNLGAEDTWKKTSGQYDKEKVVSAVKSFASEYNDVIEQSGKVTAKNGNVENQVKWMSSLTTTMKKALDKVGITVGTDNKLSVDEEKLKNADMQKVNDLFAGPYSYGSQIGEKAGAIANATMAGGLYGSNGAAASTLQSMFTQGI